ncbi:hypothetical protein [Rhodopila sp.]|uniref:hypothetical protein n=1 Tax=Rhodopila sp. TaxID=2480087 RepID=UPI003D0D4A63
MKPTSRMLLIGACLGSLAITVPAGAQPNDSNVSFDAGGLMPKKPAPRLPDIAAQPLAWPRLDPGAVVCRTEADLDKLGARRHGQHVDGPIDCQIVRAATAISIVQRSGPGRTEVKASDPKADWSGWTDAWLPEKGAVGATSVSR